MYERWEDLVAKATGTLWAGGLAGVGILILFLWLRFPVNYGSGVEGIRTILIAYGIISLTFCARADRYAVYSVLLCIALLFLSQLMDYFNLYVDYGIWIERGMPEWGQTEAGARMAMQDEDIIDGFF